MDTGGDEARDSGDRDGARPRMPRKPADQEGVLFENFTDSRMKDRAVFLQLVPGETKLMHCYLAGKTFSL